jgi:hypothetical protein
MPSIRGAAQARCSLAWRRVAVPTPPESGLSDIAARTARDVWAAGHEGPRPLILHWNGRRWHRMTLPVIDGEARLTAIASSSATDAWAVGTRLVAANKYRPLALHWDGSAWRARELANAVWDVYAVPHGTYWASDYGVVLRWIGGDDVWQKVPAESTADGGLSIAGTSDNDIWTAGAGEPGDLSASHWNGKAWQRVAIPTPIPETGNDAYFVLALAAVTARDVWAAGMYESGITQSVGLVYRWNGREWRVAQRRPGAHFNGITAPARSNVWAVGGLGSTNFDDRGGGALVAHWNGKRWRTARVPGGGLDSVDAVSTQDLWAVGRDRNGRPITLRFSCGTRAT